MTIKHLKIFLRVCEEQNMTRGARSLHMTQPAVSRAVKEMEDYYGIHLFERVNQRLLVTEAGKAFYSHARYIVDEFDEMERSMKNWDRIGTLRVGASITLGNVLLPNLVKVFKREYPQLNVQVSVSSGGILERALMENRLDLAMIEGDIRENELHGEFFREDRLLLILPPGHELMKKETLEMRDLQPYPFLLREPESAGRNFLDQVFAHHGISVSPTWQSTSTQAIVQAVAEGIGISILPQQLVAQALKEGIIQTRRIQDETFCRRNYLVWHRKKYLTPAAKRWIELCRTMAQELEIQPEP